MLVILFINLKFINSYIWIRVFINKLMKYKNNFNNYKKKMKYKKKKKIRAPS